MTYRIDSQEMEGAAVAVVTLTGTSDYDTITGMLRELDDLAPRLIFIDEAEFKPDLLSGLHIQEFAKQWRNAAALRAARMSVHAPNPVMYGLNRMFQLWAGAEEKMAVFRERDEAIAWLLGRGNEPAA